MILHDTRVPPILYSPLVSPLPRRTDIFDPSSDRFTNISSHQSFLADMEAHRAYRSLPYEIRQVLHPLALHIDLHNNKLMEFMAKKDWPQLHWEGICEKMDNVTIDNYAIDQLLTGNGSNNRIKTLLACCIIDNLLDAYLPDDDVTEAKLRLAVQYRDPAFDPEVQLFTIPSAEELESWSSQAVQGMNEGLQGRQPLSLDAPPPQNEAPEKSPPWVAKELEQTVLLPVQPLEGGDRLHMLSQLQL